MEISKKAVGNVIRTLRKRSQYTIEEFAYQSSLHPTHIGKIERGEISPSVESLGKVISVLNISYVDFFKMVSSTLDKESPDLVHVMIQRKVDTMTQEEREKLLLFLDLYH
ncbi:helix-turn-helix transcriptional regulator [Paenibacillus sp. TRM 82003]|nr:helix-turn-helix transcriptional regulator [Paenibacillus sp. TRM 82003]MCI3923398.1 helix-turn-helix transcriptional regulator [Paenibacillus sp. TRM 82003]